MRLPVFGKLRSSLSSLVLSSVALTGIAASVSSAFADESPPAQTVVSRRPAGPIEVMAFAHYVNWLSQEDWGSKTASIPLSGTYDSDDPETIRLHNREFLEHGITPLISYWGQNHRAGDEFYDLYLSIESPVKIGVLFEADRLLKRGRDGKIDFNDRENIGLFTDAMAHLDRKYFSNPKYRDRFARIDGKPVVFVWLTNAMRGPFQAAITAARQEEDFYLIGSNFNMATSILDEWKEFLPYLDAVSAYGTYDPYFINKFGGVDRNYVDQYMAGMRGWSKWLEENAPNTVIIPPMSFSYDDRYDRPGSKNPNYFMDFRTANYFTSQVRLALECGANNDQYYRRVFNAVNITSFNEHFEGTAIEPSFHRGNMLVPQADYIEIASLAYSEPITITTPDFATEKCRPIIRLEP